MCLTAYFFFRLTLSLRLDGGVNGRSEKYKIKRIQGHKINSSSLLTPRRA